MEGAFFQIGLSFMTFTSRVNYTKGESE